MPRCLIEDSRQQAGKHEVKHEGWAAIGLPFIRCKLPFGDYALVPSIAVDTKKDIQELAMDICQEHARFKRELEGARDAGCKLVILVENTDGVTDLDSLRNWRESEESFRKRRAKMRYYGSRIAAACRTMMDKYGVSFEFCEPESAAGKILEILWGGEK